VSARLGAHFTDRFHRQTRVPLEQNAEDGLALVVEKRAEHLRQIGRMLLLQQVQQVGSRANAQQPFDCFEDDIDSARWCHPVNLRLRAHNRGNVTRRRVCVAPGILRTIRLA
jgi:hypothetical protein